MGIVSPADSSILLPVFLCRTLPPTAPIGRSDRGRREQRRREQTDREPDGGQPGGALLDHVVGLLHRDVALEVLAHHDRAPQP